MEFDAIIIGGSFAGLSAAMQLVRARRRVVVIDAGKPRNRFTPASHGFLGQDGVAPAEIRRKAQEQLARYPDFILREDEAVGVRAEGEGFAVALASGWTVTGARLVLAGGIRDRLPDIPGLAERWGKSVLHCPYCHGYELGGGPIGIHLRNKVAVHQALLLPDWGDTTLFLTKEIDLDSSERERLAARGVRIETAEIAELLGEGTELSAVRLADGRLRDIVGLFVQPQTAVVGTLATDLGLDMEEGAFGAYIRTDAMGATSRAGVFAAGDATSPMHNAMLASAAGVRAGGGVHFSLVRAEASGQFRLCARA